MPKDTLAMKQQAKSKFALYTDPDRLPTKSSEDPKTDKTVKTQETRKTIEYTESIKSSLNPNVAKDLMRLLKKPAYPTEGSTRRNPKPFKSLKADRADTLPDTEPTIHYESVRPHGVSKFSMNQSFSIQRNEKKPVKANNRSLSKGIPLKDKRSPSKENKERRSTISPPPKRLHVSRNSMCSQTCVTESSPVRRGLNYTKMCNETSMKYAQEFKKRANSVVRGSKIAATPMPVKASVKSQVQPQVQKRQQTVNNVRTLSPEKQKRSRSNVRSSPKRSSSISKARVETETDKKPREKSREKQQKQEHQRSKSQEKRKVLHSFVKEKEKEKEERAVQMKTLEDENTQDIQRQYQTEPVLYKEKRSGSMMAQDMSELTEMEMMEMSTNLTAYYELLMQREQANSKLLYNLKDNFTSIMSEFLKNYKIIKQYQGFEEYYEIEKEKSQKEKDVLKLELEMLKMENSRLKGTKSGKKHSKGSADNGLIGRDIQDTIMEEKNLMELLEQREKFILFMKEKENKYITLLNAIEARGVNIDRIYEEEISYNPAREQVSDLRHPPSRYTAENSRALMTESSDNVLLDFNTQGPEQEQATVSSFAGHQIQRKPQRKTVNGSRDFQPNRTQENFWAERQFTEASNSRTMTSYSESAFMSSNHEESLYKFVESTGGLVDKLNSTNTQKDFMKRSKRKGSEAPSEKTFTSVAYEQRAREEYRPTGELKDKLKLNLGVLQHKAIKQYQDEFMEKWAEFTSSWKRAMQNDKTFHLQQNIQDIQNMNTQ